MDDSDIRFYVMSGTKSGPCDDSKYAELQCRLTNRWSGRVRDKVPSSYAGVRAAQLNR